MAVALPLLSIAAGAAGVAAATTTLGMIAAGASIVSGVATLSGNSKLARVAGIVALGAGVGSVVQGMAAGGAGGGNAVTAGAEQSATEATLNASRGNTAIADNAASVSSAAPEVAGAAAAESSSVLGNADLFGEAANSMQPGNMLGAGNGLANTPNLATEAAGFGAGNVLQQTVPAAGSLLDKASKIGRYVQQNKELVNLAGGAAYGAFGPDAQRNSLLSRRLDLEEQELNRQNANANNLTGLQLPLQAQYTPMPPQPRRV